MSLRVRRAPRAVCERFAACEMRKPGYVSQVIFESGFEQLNTAGSIDRLLKYKIRPSRAHPKGR
jgi:hypothetical protein